MRISRDAMLMGFAEIAAQRSTCYRLSVGAILALRGRAVSTGYNGPPSGEEHCQGNECMLSPSGGCLRSVHAELNAMNFVEGPLTNHELYVTTCPCGSCAQEIIKRGVSRVIFRHEYRSVAGAKFMIDSGVTLHRLTASGYLVDCATNSLIAPSIT